ncbi:MAG: HD domain-containing protein [Selenomonadaceae bacterium]|nr:HD domain-containing protein [Selenomonadaceae bacterium]
MKESTFIDRINHIGGKVYLVGGAVRDRFRGVAAHDKDYCIVGVTEADFKSALPEAFKVGNSFPVYKVNIDDIFCEVAFARRERKVGSGYRGFDTTYDPNVTIEDDLYRRDTTINAIAIELPNGELIDPYNGIEDIADKKIRIISKHFVDDPVRALRAARQSAQFQFDITDDTILAMNQCSIELANEPNERVFNELNLALQTEKPSIFFRSLERAGLLEIIFPELHQMIGKIQPTEFHPEGDAFEHSMNIVDEVANVNRNTIVRFAALVHDLGKGTTPQCMLPHHYGHDTRGLEVLNEWRRRVTFPKDWIKAAKFVIERHMHAPLYKKPGKIVDLIIKIPSSGLSFNDFNDIILADHRSLPYYLEYSNQIYKELLKVNGRDCPENLKGEHIGQWIRAERIKALRKYSEEHSL